VLRPSSSPGNSVRKESLFFSQLSRLGSFPEHLLYIRIHQAPPVVFFFPITTPIFQSSREIINPSGLRLFRHLGDYLLRGSKCSSEKIFSSFCLWLPGKSYAFNVAPDLPSGAGDTEEPLVFFFMTDGPLASLCQPLSFLGELLAAGTEELG